MNIGATAVHLEDMGGMIDPTTAAKTEAAVKKAVKMDLEKKTGDRDRLRSVHQRLAEDAGTDREPSSSGCQRDPR